VSNVNNKTLAARTEPVGEPTERRSERPGNSVYLNCRFCDNRPFRPIIFRQRNARILAPSRCRSVSATHSVSRRANGFGIWGTTARCRRPPARAAELC